MLLEEIQYTSFLVVLVSNVSFVEFFKICSFIYALVFTPTDPLKRVVSLPFGCAW